MFRLEDNILMLSSAFRVSSLEVRQHGARPRSALSRSLGGHMQSFQVRCPQCSHLLGASGSGQHSMFNIRCAACGTVFSVQVAQPVGPAAPPPPPPSQLASSQAVQNLCALGFSEAQARDALRSSNGDVERAATLLLARTRLDHGTLCRPFARVRLSNIGYLALFQGTSDVLQWHSTSVRATVEQ